MSGGEEPPLKLIFKLGQKNPKMLPFLGVPTSAQGRQCVRTALFGPLFILMGEDAAVVAFTLVPRCNEREEDSASYCNQAGHLLQLKKMSLDRT